MDPKKFENTSSFLGLLQNIFSGIMGAWAVRSTRKKSAPRRIPRRMEEITKGLVQGRMFPPVFIPRIIRAVAAVCSMHHLVY